jgi:hypothetical protein
MNVASSSLFSQLLSLIGRNRFAKLVRETGSERRAKGFASWDPFVAMPFCQLAHAESLREAGPIYDRNYVRDWRLSGRLQIRNHTEPGPVMLASSGAASQEETQPVTTPPASLNDP